MIESHQTMRKETDLLGEKEIPEDALYGIHSLRARENFPDSTAFPQEWYKAIGMVKQACYLTVIRYPVSRIQDTIKLQN